MTLRVRQRQNALVGFNEELDFIAPENSEKRVPVRLLKLRFKTKFAALECDGVIDVADDEEW